MLPLANCLAACVHSQYILSNHTAILSAGAILGTRNVDLFELKTLQGSEYFERNCMYNERFEERRRSSHSTGEGLGDPVYINVSFFLFSKDLY